MTEQANARRRERYANDPEYRQYYLAKAAKWNRENPEKARASVDRYIRKQHENINSPGN